MSGSDPDPSDLERRLRALHSTLGGIERRREPTPQEPPRIVLVSLLGIGVTLGAVAFGIGHLEMLIPAGILSALSGSYLLRSRWTKWFPARAPDRAHVGMGATVSGDAVIEPGGVVEMGATVGPGVVVKRGAIVRMGATVTDGATLEEGAVVGWGATVQGKLTLGQGVVVGAGATVTSDVPAGTRLLPGTTWAGRSTATSEPARASAPRDPREQRIDESCRRIDEELAQLSPEVRRSLGASAQLASVLRETCRGLIERERALRKEGSAERLTFLEDERRQVQARLDAAGDEAVRRSLTSALEAIALQRQQRELLQKSAERIEAELTRLTFTLEAMATQLVRVRNAGGELARGEGLTETMRQLQDELDAIAGALEAEARSEPLAPIGDALAAPTRTRERE